MKQKKRIVCLNNNLILKPQSKISVVLFFVFLILMFVFFLFKQLKFKIEKKIENSIFGYYVGLSIFFPFWFSIPIYFKLPILLFNLFFIIVVVVFSNPPITLYISNEQKRFFSPDHSFHQLKKMKKCHLYFNECIYTKQ